MGLLQVSESICLCGTGVGYIRVRVTASDLGALKLSIFVHKMVMAQEVPLIYLYMHEDIRLNHTTHTSDSSHVITILHSFHYVTGSHHT